VSPVRHAALLAALAAVAAGCGDEVNAPHESAGAAAWTRAADLPLSARYAPLLVWTGEEVLALGGHTGPPCPPNADCATLDDTARDGAAYDPDTDAWRLVADAPIDLDRFTGHVVVDGELVVGDVDGWWSFSPGSNTWAELPAPPTDVGPPETVRDGLVYSHVQRRVHSLDLATGTWSELPEDPLGPPLTDGSVFATDAGLVLTGVNYEEAAPDEPTLTQADLWNGHAWQRFPRTGMIGPLYHWTGERLVGLEIGGADGGQVNGWDRWYPFAGALDVATGRWSEISGVPGYEDLDRDLDRGAWRVEAADGPRVATAGFVYDDDTGTWTRLERPDSALEQELTGVWVGDRLVVVGGADKNLARLPEVWVRAP
jgi:hypothetical protein